MAYTRISDVFVPEVLAAQIAAEVDTASNGLIRSGAVAADPILAAAAAGQRGSKLTIPQYSAYAAADAVGSDVEGEVLGTNARTSFEIDVPMLRRVVSFDAMDLARAEANADPLGDLAVQAAAQIIRNQNEIIGSTLRGVLADNEANDNGDMVVDVSVANNASPVAATNQFGRAALIRAVSQWGDFGSQAAVLVMHSAVYYKMLEDNTADDLRASENGFVGSFMGIPVVLDDVGTVVGESGSGANGSLIPATYLTKVLAPGSIGFASMQAAPVLDRNEKVGNGWGAESVIVRRTDLVNPKGIDFAGTANVANSVLSSVGTWNRRFDRKNVGIAFIRSNVDNHTARS